MLEKDLELLFPISPLVSSFGVQKLTFSSVSPNFVYFLESFSTDRNNPVKV